MRKQDIKPGVVYAYAQSRKPWSYDAVLILDTKQLYQWRRYAPFGLEKARAGARPSTARHWGQEPIGYLILKGKAEELATLNWERVYLKFLEAGTNYEHLDIEEGSKARFGLVTNLAYLHGEYHEVVTAHEKAEREAQERRRRAEEHQARERARAEAAVTGLQRAGLSSAFAVGTYGRGVQLSTEDAERLSYVLEAVAKLPTEWRECADGSGESGWGYGTVMGNAEDLDNALFVLQRKGEPHD